MIAVVTFALTVVLPLMIRVAFHYGDGVLQTLLVHVQLGASDSADEQ